MAKVVKSELPTVSLKLVYLSVPSGEEEQSQLVEDLTQMGCEGLLLQPWNLQSEAMVREFLQDRSNKWKRMIRRLPKH